MRRRIENPRIVLLDCNLEYKKSANPLTHKVGAAPDWEKIMKQVPPRPSNIPLSRTTISLWLLSPSIGYFMLYSSFLAIILSH